MRLENLCRNLERAALPEAAAQLEVHAVRDDSRAVQPGDVFVAVPGEDQDGRQFIADAVARGAIAIVADTDVAAPVPVVRVPDARTALAQLAAESLGRPADSLRLVGLTGTLGKTSVLTMLDAILTEAGVGAGTVGSLGIRFAGQQDVTPNTTPGAVELQTAMAEMVRAGVRVMAMEVTSHALSQGRVHGMHYDVGVFTNLVMLEHMEYHGSFEGYARAKLRFFEHLKRGAPIVYAAGDRAVAAAVQRHDGPRISVGSGNAMVSIRREALSVEGTRITLNIRRPLPRLDAEPLPPCSIGVSLAALGRTNIMNAALAASTALCLGADARAVQTALAAMPPVRRRMQILQRSGPIIIDDTVGHPDSISGIFEVVRRVRHRRLHVVFCIRGQRGPVINERDAEALAVWFRKVPVETLITTSAVDTANERNAVDDEERTAFNRVLEDAGLTYQHAERLEDALETVMAAAGERDLVLLLGAQGMDAAADLLRRSGRIREPNPDPAHHT